MPDYTRLPIDQQLALIHKDAMNIRFIRNPDEKVQLAAISKYPDALKFIENPTSIVKTKVLHDSPESLLIPILWDNIDITKAYNNRKDEIIKSLEYFMDHYTNDDIIFYYARMKKCLDEHNIHWEELDRIENTLKDEVLREILGNMSEDFESSSRRGGFEASFRQLYNRLRRESLNWPELEVIKNSIEADK